MNKNKFTEKNLISRISFFLAGVIIVALFFYIFLILKDIKNISNDIYQARLELEKKYLTGITLKKNAEHLSKLKPRLEKIDQSIIKYENNLSFINDLENTADKLGLNLNIDIPDVKIEENKIIASPIQLTINGNLNSALEYLEKLDRKNYYLNFAEIKLINDISSQDKNEEIVTLIMKGKIYWN